MLASVISSLQSFAAKLFHFNRSHLLDLRPTTLFYFTRSFLFSYHLSFENTVITLYSHNSFSSLLPMLVVGRLASSLNNRCSRHASMSQPWSCGLYQNKMSWERCAATLGLLSPSRGKRRLRTNLLFRTSIQIDLNGEVSRTFA